MTEPASQPEPQAAAEAPAAGRKPRRTATGVVTSTAAAKTLRVQVNRMVKDPVYGKYLKRRTTLHAHDEQEVAKVGDVVELMACRPISKTKSWRLVRVIRGGEQG